MAEPDPNAVAAEKAPQAFKGWRHLRGTVNVAIPASLRNARKLTRNTKRQR